MSDSIRIVSFQASNFKKLTAVQIDPSGAITVLAGDNGAGKSSILDGIEATLTGKDALPEKPIRDGATKGHTTTLLSNGLSVHRSYTSAGSTLTVKDAEGEPQRSPQALLDKLVGPISFDPLSFARMKPADQKATLQKLVGLDFSGLDAERKKAFDERTIVNREVDRLTTVVKALVPRHADAPAAEVSAATVIAEIEHAEAQVREFERLKGREEAKRQEIAKQKLEIANAEKQIAAWQKILADAKVSLGSAQHDFEQAGRFRIAFSTPDVTSLKTKLAALEGENLKVRQNKLRATTEEALGIVQSQANALAKKLVEIDGQKDAALRNTKFPLPGLSFTEDGIFYQGQPFSQISDGEKLRVSVAMGMTMNPQLRVIFIRDGSLLDAKGLALIAEMAAANNYQVWMEDARSTDPAKIVIEDGHIKTTNE